MSKAKNTTHEILPGCLVFLQTVTFAYTGRVVSSDDRWLAIDRAAWISDTGRFADAMKSGEFAEVEPYPADQVVLVQVATIVTIMQWPHALPQQQK